MIKYRSAITGEYVTEEYALENPDTTVAEESDGDGTDSIIILTPPPQPSPNPPPINPTPPKDK
jgi:hypothetical protein